MKSENLLRKVGYKDEGIISSFAPQTPIFYSSYIHIPSDKVVYLLSVGRHFIFIILPTIILKLFILFIVIRFTYDPNINFYAKN